MCCLPIEMTRAVTVRNGPCCILLSCRSALRFSGAVLALRSGVPCYFILFLKESIYVCIWLCWVFVAVRGLSLVAGSGVLLFVIRGLLVAVASLVAEHGL